MAIVGAGFTGLWTAYYLARRPALRIVVLEARVRRLRRVSGRNGGWCSALFPTSARRSSRGGTARDAARRHAAARCRTRSTRSAGSPPPRASTAHYAKGGTIVARPQPASCGAPQDEVAAARRSASGRTTSRCSTPPRPATCWGVTARARRASFTPHCAARAPGPAGPRPGAGPVERLGVTIHERTPRHAHRARAGVDHAARHGARRHVVRATEGYTAGLPGPAPRGRAGLLADDRHRAAARRRSGSGSGCAGRRDVHRRPPPDHLRPAHRRRPARVRRPRRAVPLRLAVRAGATTATPAVHAELRAHARELFPALARRRITHRWGGPLGVAARLDARRSASTGDRARLGRRLRRRRRRARPTSPAARSPTSSSAGDTDLTALPWVGPPVARLGARAAALAGHQRGAAPDRRSPTSRSASPGARRAWPACSSASPAATDRPPPRSGGDQPVGARPRRTPRRRRPPPWCGARRRRRGPPGRRPCRGRAGSGRR